MVEWRIESRQVHISPWKLDTLSVLVILILAIHHGFPLWGDNMKTWQHILLGIFIGIALAAAFMLIASPPRGNPVTLLPAPTLAPILIQVDGAVKNPGVYSLPRESRVRDAIESAGGYSEKASANSVNLAARIKDGEKIIVPSSDSTPIPANAAGASTNLDSRAVSLPTGLVNLNTATASELETLPGIGQTRAGDIITYREAHGGFKSIEEIQEVSGIGPATFERLKDLITVE